MRRAESDIEKLLAERIRIRLCKGAYKEPDEIAFQKKSEVDANYIRLMKVLMKSGVYHGLATHDENIILQARALCGSPIFRVAGKHRANALQHGGGEHDRGPKEIRLQHVRETAAQTIPRMQPGQAL